MNINELKNMIKDREILLVYVKADWEEGVALQPLFIGSSNITNDYFECPMTNTWSIRIHYKDYMTKFWLKSDMSE